jgi:hypothetical protein
LARGCTKRVASQADWPIGNIEFQLRNAVAKIDPRRGLNGAQIALKTQIDDFSEGRQRFWLPAGSQPHGHKENKKQERKATHKGSLRQQRPFERHC